jgi:hypothetical protein
MGAFSLIIEVYESTVPDILREILSSPCEVKTKTGL